MPKIKDYLNILCCPHCGGALTEENSVYDCKSCKVEFGTENDIPLFFSPNNWDQSKKDVTETIKSFYEETPFPNYDDLDDTSSLITKARKGVFAKLLDEQIPYGIKILECGCGTGQLSNFLSVANRHVFGADMCLNSLKLANEFKIRNGLENCNFLQMNLFKPCFKPESFDIVISNGVLHHTSDPFLAYSTISKLVKPGGYLLVGLYHKYGRISNDIRRFIFNLTNNRFTFLDRYLSSNISQAKRKAWFADQYKNPHESKHTLSQTIEWVRKINFDFIFSIPKTTLFNSFSANEKIFVKDNPGSGIERFFIDFGMLFTGNKEGGFFVVIAKKPKR